jgi:hypothetical protein
MQSFPILTLPRKALAVITAERFVSPTGAVATAAGNTAGVARSNAAVGETFPVDVLGTAIVQAAAAIADGAEIEVGAAGQAVTKSAGKVVARALQAAAGAGSRIEVLLIPN